MRLRFPAQSQGSLPRKAWSVGWLAASPASLEPRTPGLPIGSEKLAVGTYTEVPETILIMVLRCG